MRNFLAIITLIFIFSCGRMADKPKNLLSKEKMSETIADFAIYDQTYYVEHNINMELVSRYVLKKNNITAKDYRESYKYYLSNPSDIDDILEDAKKIILEKDEKSGDSIRKRINQNINVPAFAK